MFMNFISDSRMTCSVSKRVNRPLVSKSYFWSIFLIHLTWEEKPLWNILGLGIVFESPFKEKKLSQWNIVGHHATPIRMLRYWIAHFMISVIHALGNKCWFDSYKRIDLLEGIILDSIFEKIHLNEIL